MIDFYQVKLLKAGNTHGRRGTNAAINKFLYTKPVIQPAFGIERHHLSFSAISLMCGMAFFIFFITAFLSEALSPPMTIIYGRCL